MEGRGADQGPGFTEVLLLGYRKRYVPSRRFNALIGYQGEGGLALSKRARKRCRRCFTTFHTRENLQRRPEKRARVGRDSLEGITLPKVKDGQIPRDNFTNWGHLQTHLLVVYADYETAHVQNQRPLNKSDMRGKAEVEAVKRHPVSCAFAAVGHGFQVPKQHQLWMSREPDCATQFIIELLALAGTFLNTATSRWL